MVVSHFDGFTFKWFPLHGISHLKILRLSLVEIEELRVELCCSSFFFHILMPFSILDNSMFVLFRFLRIFGHTYIFTHFSSCLMFFIIFPHSCKLHVSFYFFARNISVL